MTVKVSCMNRTAAAALVAIACLVSCGAPTGADQPTVAIGSWAGDHIRLDVAAAGAVIEYDCAHGTIDEPLLPDRAGRFSAAGSHTFEHGGPIRIDELPNRHPARYDGLVVANTLEMTVTVIDTGQVIGTFTATFGAAARVLKCL